MKERIITGVIFGLLFILPFYMGGKWFIYLTLILSLIAYYEFSTIVKIRVFGSKWIVGLIGVFLLFSPLLINGFEQIQIKVLMALVLFFIASTVFNMGFSIEKAGALLIGILYISLGFSTLAESRIEEGIIYTLTILISIWATDSGAYFVGRRLGKRKLAKRISPNKTIEGAIGGIITSLIIVVLLQIVISPFENFIETFVIILFVTIASQIGDLVESAFKRHFGVKDSGKILPGHGGILDRFDSWIFVFIGLKVIGLV